MAAERERLASIEARLLNSETVMSQVDARMKTLQETTVGLGDQLEQVTADLRKYATGLASEKLAFAESLNAELDEHKSALAAVVNGAREEFAILKGHITELHGNTAQTFGEVKLKVEKLEADIQRGSVGKGPSYAVTHGYLPMKTMVPAVFGGTDEQWRGWQEDIADYVDSQKRGMKGVLKAAEKEIGPLDDFWVSEQTMKHAVDAKGEKANVYRALKALTSGEAKTVVQGVREEDGYLAWRALHQRFGPSVAARQGKVMCDLSQMVAKPAKNPAETRTLVSELERRIRVAEDITGDALGDGHIKSILASILDPTTRAHTSAFQGVSSSYQELKRAVLEFANNTVANKMDGPEPMNIGKCAEERQPMWGESLAEETWEVVSEQPQPQLAAVTPNTQCFNCGGYGHFAHTCSTAKGKGKGAKGGPKGGKGEAPKGGKSGMGLKGGPKGGKKGPAGGCWTCGGQHFASECPTHGGKSGKGGKGGKGFNLVEQWWPEPSVRPLCALRSTRPTLNVANRFAALSSDEEDLDQPRVPTLGDYMPKAQESTFRQPQKQRKLQGQPAAGGRLSPLATIEPEGLSPVVDAPKWEAIELAVDSGASETVIPEGSVRSAQLVPSEASKRGVQYEVANGERIPNLGQKTFTGVTEAEGLLRGITAQVCEVNKPLLSVARLVKAGNTVVFSPEGSYVEDNGTQERLWLQESGGMFMLKLWVPAEGF